jgi:cell wall-associated NlpC family hydrolase
VATTIAGVDKIEVLQQNLQIAQNFTPMTGPEMQALREKTRSHAGDGHFELYKTSIKYDNPQARLAHDFPIDQKSVEVQEMLAAAKNTGKPYEFHPAPPK